MLLVSGSARVASAQSVDVHPDIGTKPPREMLNKDLSALPIKEQQAWMHGAVSQAITVLSHDNKPLSACISEWYFGNGNGAATLAEGVRRYPDMATAPMVWVVAQRACPGN